MTLGQYLRSLRKAMRKVSLEDIAVQVGTSKSYIWEIEADRSSPSFAKAKLIAKAYKTTPNKMSEYI